MTHTNINKNISTHSFRHKHCALLIEAGVHIKEIQERLRHKDINTTMNIYAKITNSYKKTLPKSLVNSWKTSVKNYFRIFMSLLCHKKSSNAFKPTFIGVFTSYLAYRPLQHYHYFQALGYLQLPLQ